MLPWLPFSDIFVIADVVNAQSKKSSRATLSFFENININSRTFTFDLQGKEISWLIAL